ncbi:MAG: hypothetical protein IKG46_03940 [Solobacterium sp.]|nr:hypothetical protein [Solobacterium sp.]
MSKLEVIEKMFDSENGGLIAAIGGIVLVYGIDRITKYHYTADVNKDSITLSPSSADPAADEEEATEVN